MPSSPTNIQQQLEQKRADLKTLEGQLDELQAKATSLQSDVQSLGALSADYDHTVGSYQTQLAATQAAKKTADDKVAALVMTNSEKVKARKDDIDKAIAAQEKTLTDQADAVTKTRKDADDAQMAATTAAANAKVADDALRDLRNTIPSSTASLASVNALLTQANAAAASGNDAGAYFLLNEAKKITVALPSAEDLQKQLATAQDKTLSTKTDLASKQAAASKAKAASEKATRDLAVALGQRQATIVDALKPLNVAAPPPPPVIPQAPQPTV